MGWSSGTSLFEDLINTLMKNVHDDEDRKAIYLDMIEAFEAHDWDNLDECVGIDNVYDEIYEERFPTEEVVDDEDDE